MCVSWWWEVSVCSVGVVFVFWIWRKQNVAEVCVKYDQKKNSVSFIWPVECFRTCWIVLFDVFKSGCVSYFMFQLFLSNMHYGIFDNALTYFEYGSPDNIHGRTVLMCDRCDTKRELFCLLVFFFTSSAGTSCGLKIFILDQICLWLACQYY